MCEKMRFWGLVFLSTLTVFPSAFASVVQPGDGPYSRLRKGRILYVYGAESRESIPQIAAYMEAIRAGYDESFRWKLDEEQDLVLTSPAQQIANAYATVMPNIKSVWFPSGGGFLDSSAESSWLLGLATHETAHLYQLNAKGATNSFLKSIFGNTFYIFPFVWPVFIHPNVLTPTFLIEGNAVLNESRANMGGRLHSGEYRAIVLAQIKAGDIDPARLINNEFKFPFGTTPYLQGGYFQAHLAAKYGVDKTNQFFAAQGEHYLWPLILNRTFRDHFGASYSQEIREYVREMQGLADKQQVSAGKTLQAAMFFSPLNHDAKRIFYLESDGIRPAILHTISKTGGSSAAERLDLPLGKVFFEGDRAEVAVSDQNDLHHVTYSLYGEHREIDPRFAGQIVSDRRAGRTVALDAANSWLEGRLLLNGENYDVSHSSPILDEQGDVYYFRQNGSERVLYKNRQPVFKYDGFYGKLTEVGADGTIYFIACTDSGSTLYQYKDKEIQRVLDSDVVVDARQLDANRFVADEVGADGHRIVLAESHPRPAAPAVYSYGFQTYHLKPEKLADAEQLKEDERPYNSFSQMRYSGMDFSSGYDSSNGLNGLINASFVDPMNYQEFNFGGQGSTEGSQGVFAGYAFTKYLPQFNARYVYLKEIWHETNGAARKAYKQQAATGMSLPLLRWRRWDANWDVFGLFTHDAKRVTPAPARGDFEETYGVYNSLTLQFQQLPDPGIGFFPVQDFTLNYQNKLESLPGSWKKKYNTSLVQSRYQRGFPLQFYASLSGQVAWAENHDIDISYNPEPLTTDIRIPRLVPHDYYTVKTASAARFEIEKVFNTPGYLTRIPISIERVAPLLVAQGLFFDRDSRGYGDYPDSIFEWGYGADLQLLLFHLGAVKLRVLNAFDTRHPVRAGGDQQAYLSSRWNF